MVDNFGRTGRELLTGNEKPGRKCRKSLQNKEEVKWMKKKNRNVKRRGQVTEGNT